MYSSEFFAPQVLGENFENALEISGNLIYEKCGHPGSVMLHIDLRPEVLTELSHNKNKGINLHAGVCIY